MTNVLEARGISKAYGNLLAVDDTDFFLKKGEIHVLLGANGCGKSTLCKVVAGAIPATSGSVELNGETVSFGSPLAAREAGIATVYQELSLNPTQSVADNIYLGLEIKRLGFVDRSEMKSRTIQLLESLGALGQGLDPDSLVGDLSIDQKQIVEIAKALVLDPQVILFDESTSSLDSSQVRAFFDLVRGLKNKGTSIIFISHRMEEIFEIGDRVTVMNDGKCVATCELSETDRGSLVSLMVGEEFDVKTHERVLPINRGSELPILSLKDFRSAKLKSFSLDVYAGEIVGLGGLHGQGQSDLLLSIFGSQTRLEGFVHVKGDELKPNSPIAALRAGLTYVSGDRGRDGALHGRPILENFTLSMLSKGSDRLLNPKMLIETVSSIAERLRLKHGGYFEEIGSLSGGNQQKTVIGRALATNPNVLLLDDPTKGIDVRAKRDLFDLLRELCASGMAILLYSSEDAELLENSDRILVFNSGSVVNTLEGSRMTEFELNQSALRTAA